MNVIISSLFKWLPRITGAAIDGQRSAGCRLISSFGSGNWSGQECADSSVGQDCSALGSIVQLVSGHEGQEGYLLAVVGQQDLQPLAAEQEHVTAIAINTLKTRDFVIILMVLLVNTNVNYLCFRIHF